MARAPVTVIVSTSSAWELTRECLESLVRTLGARDQVVVADDGRSDRISRELAGMGGVEVVRYQPDTVVGWHHGVARAQHETVVLLDSATVPTGHWLDPLVRALDEDPTVGAAGPRTDGGGGPQTVGGADYYTGRSAMRAFARTWCADHRGEVSRTEELEGFCVAVRRSVLDHLLGAGAVGSTADRDAGAAAPEAVRGHDFSGGVTDAGYRLVICHDSFVHRSSLRRRPPLVSACLITKDEQADIAGCLASLQGFVDEIVIYDTGSTDDTIRIARDLGATVIEGWWDDDFARARNAALAHCRGDWIAWLDADETLVCDDVEALRRLLVQTKPDIDAWSVAIDNLTGVGVGAHFVHYAARLFRREGREWSGRLHEQIINPRKPAGISQAVLEIASLRHTGYLEQIWRTKGKTERNLRIAAAEVTEGTGEEKGLSLLTLARSYYTGGLLDQAVEHCGLALDSSDNAIVRRMALRLGAESLLHLSRTEEALEWASRLRAECTLPTQVDTLEADIRLARHEYGAALECLDRVGAGGRDEDGFARGPEQLAGPRAEALAGLGRPGEAADVLLACLSQSETLDLHLGRVLGYLEAAGRPAAELAAVIPADKASFFLAQILQLQPRPADTLLDACFEQMVNKSAVLAAAATLAVRLDVDRALVWSARLRAAGHADACPLLAQAASPMPAVGRARAAAVAYRMFGDERAYRAYEAIAQRASPEERAEMRPETVAICPELTVLLEKPGAPVPSDAGLGSTAG